MSQPSIVLEHIKPTQAQIAKFINKKQKKQRKYKSKKKLRIEKNIRVQKQESSIQSNEVIPSEMTIEQTVDENNGMDESVQKEETPIQPIKLISCVNIKQEMHNNDYMMDNGTQSMDNMSNVSNDFDPNIVIKQEVEDEDHGYTTNYNDVEEEDDNMFDDSSNNFIPGIFNREMQNDNMGNYMHIPAQGNMFGQSNNFIPNFNYGQGHNVVNMKMVLPHYMYNSNGEILPVTFHNNDNEWINNAQGDMYNPSNNLIPNIVHGQGFQNNDYVGNNISYQNGFITSSSNGYVPYIPIKQEVLEE
ncbi:putative mediator of RNA polymerase II transcription subunit 26 isoform X1 [Aphis gossypii]|uniref:putative mediator of RNA polymerase II transcription subunit 26 isoform X1 n=1 Tax=Aphis gossypii TaxID=80765 RepID=UPI0021593465|nr:putative mediator of RNA polymerase II transcription subunit 26 isoform X1 [Aphis gossypii]